MRRGIILRAGKSRLSRAGYMTLTALVRSSTLLLLDSRRISFDGNTIITQKKLDDCFEVPRAYNLSQFAERAFY